MGLCINVVSAVGHSENLFFASVSFHLEMFDVTNFKLVLVIFNVHVVIVIKNNKYKCSGSVFVNF